MKKYHHLISELNIRKALSYPACSVQSLAHVINKPVNYIRKNYEKYVKTSNYFGIPDLVISISDMLTIIEKEGFQTTKIKPLKYSNNNSELNFGKTLEYLKNRGTYLIYSKSHNHIAGINNNKIVDTNSIFGISLSYNTPVSKIYSIT